MRLDVIILPFILLFVIGCKASSCDKDRNNDEIFTAINEGNVQDLEEILSGYDGDVTEKIYSFEDGDTKIMLSPFEMTIVRHEPEMLSLMIEKKRPTINIHIFEIVIESSSVECFEVLLDHSIDLLKWDFNRNLLQRILSFSVDNDYFMNFVSKFSKRLDFNDKLALIENAFYFCTDRENIIFTVDAVILDIALREIINGNYENSERAAILSLARSMIFKLDFDDMLSWIDTLYFMNPETKTSKQLIEDYKVQVKIFDERDEDYSQPEDIAILEDFQVYLKFAPKPEIKINFYGPRVLLRLLNKNNKRIWEILRQSPRLEEIERTVKLFLDASIQSNLKDFVAILLEGGFDFSESVIFDAVSNRAAETLQLLLNHGANVNLVNSKGDTPLMKAAHGGSVEIVELLLKNGADANLVNSEGFGPLHVLTLIGGSSEIAELLLQFEADPNLTDNNGHTPLVAAVIFSDSKLAETLLKHGADPNVEYKEGELILMDAVSRNNVDILELLLKYGASPNFTSIFGYTPLLKAIFKNSPRAVELLLKYNADINAPIRSGYAPLTYAIEYSTVQVVETLLKNGADPNVSDHRRNLPLILAVESNKAQVVELLLKYKADMNVSNTFGDSLFIAAIRKSSARIVELFLEYGANPNLDSFNREMPLLAAVRSNQDGIVEILLKHKADIYASSSDAFTPFIDAIKYSPSRIVEIFLEYGANPNFIYNRDLPLIAAAENDKFEIVGLLLKHSADVNGTDRTGKTPLMAAIRHSSAKIVKLLLENGAILEYGEYDHNRPLLEAIKKDKVEIVELLLKHKADPNGTDMMGFSLLQTAKAHQSSQRIIDLLLEYGATAS